MPLQPTDTSQQDYRHAAGDMGLIHVLIGSTSFLSCFVFQWSHSCLLYKAEYHADCFILIVFQEVLIRSRYPLLTEMLSVAGWCS